jgi:two-component system chemotaxis response regulator CheB
MINKQRKRTVVVIGGSAGSFPVVNKILSELNNKFDKPIIMALHRLKHVRAGFAEALSIRSAVPVIEPVDKEKIKSRHAYLAPANYHLLVELGGYVSLSTTEMVHYSRPSIDVLFETAAYAYNSKLVAIILSGANKDGVDGLRRVKDMGGLTIVQNPTEAKINIMPRAAIDGCKVDHILKTDEIITFLNQL